MTADLLGVQLQFAIGGVDEITRVDGFSTERAFARRMIDSLTPGDVVYDVGANIGIISMLLAAVGSHQGVAVHAFEPELDNIRALSRNIQLNALSNITVHPVALGASSGKARLFLSGHSGTGTHSLKAHHRKSDRSIEIEVRTAVEVAQATRTSPQVVKIDVEGAEMDVLCGLADLLARKIVRDLFVEVHGDTLIAAGSSPDAVRSFVSDHDFDLIWSQQRQTEQQLHFHRRSS